MGALVVADNTFLSPALQRPIEHGADIVVHSTTKFINGHSDVVGGAVIAADPAVLEHLAWWANALGLVGAPFDSFLTLRGLRTLDARIRVHQENAADIADVLTGTVPSRACIIPAGRSMTAMMSRGSNRTGSDRWFRSSLSAAKLPFGISSTDLRCFSLAESLGGVESLVAHPATMTHAAMDEDAKAIAGITPGLLRLSVGIEHPDDLVGDLVDALDRAAANALAEAC